MAKSLKLRAKELGLSKKDTAELFRLKETEVILNAQRIYYDEEKIRRALKDVNDRIKVLAEEREEILEKRQKLSAAKTKEILAKLQKNSLHQQTILSNNGLLTKLKKAKATVKAIEKTIEEVNGIINTTKS